MYSYDFALEESKKYFNGDELAAKVFLDKYALRNENAEILEKTPEEMHWRIAKEFARIEKNKFKSPLSEEEIFSYLDRCKYIIPQGSPMFGIGNKYQTISLSNCYLLDTPLDNYSSILDIDKNKCVIKVHYEKWKFIQEEWVIDICRGPVHIKKGNTSIEVLKREGSCLREEYQSTPFCNEWKKIKLIIQDDGLIFADGEKEDLSTDHGKTFCSYLMIKKYLQDGVIFGRGLKKDQQGPFSDDEPAHPLPRPQSPNTDAPEKGDAKTQPEALKF